MTNPSSDDHGLGLGIRRRGLAFGPRGAAQLLLDGLPEVLQQMEAIGYLLGPRRALASAFRVETAAIPADDVKTGMARTHETLGFEWLRDKARTLRHPKC
jgi:hypothetical protein